jgi:hypothetical protein
VLHGARTRTHAAHALCARRCARPAAPRRARAQTRRCAFPVPPLCRALTRAPARRAAELADAAAFAAFYHFAFFVAREPAQRNLSVETALLAWPLVLRGRFRLLDKWCAFVAATRRLGITEDTWRQARRARAAAAARARCSGERAAHGSPDARACARNRCSTLAGSCTRTCPTTTRRRARRGSRAARGCGRWRAGGGGPQGPCAALTWRSRRRAQGAWPVLVDEFVDALCGRAGAAVPHGARRRGARSDDGYSADGEAEEEGGGGGAAAHLVGRVPTAGSKRRAPSATSLETSADVDDVAEQLERLAASPPKRSKPARLPPLAPGGPGGAAGGAGGDGGRGRGAAAAAAVPCWLAAREAEGDMQT